MNNDLNLLAYFLKIHELVAVTSEKSKKKAVIRNTIRPCGYKTFFMLNSTENDFFPAHKY